MRGSSNLSRATNLKMAEKVKIVSNDKKETTSPSPLTSDFLILMGECCGYGCKRCPYTPKHTKGSTEIVKQR